MANEAHYIAMQAGCCPLSISHPGFAKTSSVLHHLVKMGRKPYVLIGSICDPSDFGVPFPASEVRTYKSQAGEEQIAYFHLACPEWVANCCTEDNWAIVMDELVSAPPAVHAGLLRIIAERCIGEQRLPENTWMCAMSNPVSTAVNGFDLQPAMANRLVHLKWETDWDVWDAGVTTGDWDTCTPPIVPENWRETHRAEAAWLVSSFRRVANLEHFQPRTDSHGEIAESADVMSGAWPSMRSWTMAIDCIAAHKACGLSDNTARNKMLYGCVGSAASAFIEWEAACDLPDPGIVVEEAAQDLDCGKPAMYPKQKTIEKNWMLLNGIALNVCGNLEDKTRYNPRRWQAACELIVAAYKDGLVEQAVMATTTLVSRKTGDRTKSIIPEGANVPDSLYETALRKRLEISTAQ
jgi:hypothetical protein